MKFYIKFEKTCRMKPISRSKIIFSAVLFLASFSGGLMAQETWNASPAIVAKLSKSQSEFNYYEEKVPQYKLPPLLISSAGKQIASASDWTKVRRPEILELFRENVFGRVPDTKYTKSFKVVNTDRNAMNGAATLKQVEITIASGGKSLVIHLTLFVPNKVDKPVPVFLLIDNRGPNNTDPTRKLKSPFWPAEEVIARGYAISVFSNADLDPDDFDDFKNGIHGLLDRGRRKPDAWGSLAAWAWGASRCMDYFEKDKDIDSRKVAVVGHSRGGKTALWTGAEDQRFSVVIANESGAGGASLARRRYGETVARISSAFPHWFCTNYNKYAGNEEAMPFDMHMLLALTAPRALYIDAASDDLWGDPRGCYLSLLNALPAFQLFDKASSVPALMPPLNRQVMSGHVGFHIRDGVHDMTVQDWNCFMDFADSFWKK
jgi:pimeloyl-ACP methyl ester carboxylesterase